MTRKRKLFTVGAILAAGLVLAWPFRKTGTDTEPAAPVVSPPADTLRASNGDPIAMLQTATPEAEVPVAPAQVAALTASTGPAGDMPKIPRKLESFDLANHPALAVTPSLPTSDRLTPEVDTASPATQPAYSTNPTTSKVSVEEWPAELVHVVANGDTLEKLAERYLNDAGRALEIFDLNRDQLSNPHLLPIGVELRVPRNPDRIVD